MERVFPTTKHTERRKPATSHLARRKGNEMLDPVPSMQPGPGVSFRTGTRKVSSPHCLFWSLELATASLLTSGPFPDTQAQLRNRAPKKLRNMDAAGRSMWQRGPSTEIAL
jgi:hypothetical protein